MSTLEHYYLSEEISDLRFLVHDEERAHEHSLPAHLFVLHMNSTYWQRMLASGLREATESRIRIDAAVESVKLVLHFIYTGKALSKDEQEVWGVPRIPTAIAGLSLHSV
jgi:hypothetical protein